MDSKNLESSLKEALVSLQHYLDLQVRYNKLLIAKQLGEISSVFALFMILLIIFSFAIFFLSFWFVDWFAANVGPRYYGNLIVFGFYALIGISLIIFREPIIFRPIRKMFASSFAGDEETGTIYDSKESIIRQLLNYKETIKEEEEDLKEKFEDLNNAFTITNILQSISKSFYKTFMTTSNFAKAGFFLVQKIKSRLSKSKSKKSRKKPPQIEDGDY